MTELEFKLKMSDAKFCHFSLSWENHSYVWSTTENISFSMMLILLVMSTRGPLDNTEIMHPKSVGLIKSSTDVVDLGDTIFGYSF